jgi:hypothetical protein
MGLKKEESRTRCPLTVSDPVLTKLLNQFSKKFGLLETACKVSEETLVNGEEDMPSDRTAHMSARLPKTQKKLLPEILPHWRFVFRSLPTNTTITAE